MNKKKIILIVSAVLVLGLLVFAGYKLYSGISAFAQAEKDLQTSMTRLSRFYLAKPFPSQENIKKEDTNIKTLKDWFSILVEGIRKGQIADSSERRPSKFIDTLTQKRNEMLALVAEIRPKVILSDDFALGFARYSTGNLPDPKYVPRLTQQLVILDSVCKLMIDSGVREIVHVQREIIEESQSSKSSGSRRKPASSRSRRKDSSSSLAAASRPTLVNPDAGLFVDNSLYTKFHFSFLIKSDEASFVTLLNKISESPLFIVTTKVVMQKDPNDVVMPKKESEEEAGVQKKGTKKATPGLDFLSNILNAGKVADPAVADEKKPGDDDEVKPVATAPVRLSRMQRRVSGDDFEKPIEFLIEVDVYRFDEVKTEQ